MFPREEIPRGGGPTVAAVLVAVTAALMLGAALLPTPALANSEGIINPPTDPHAPTKDSGWQAGTCSAEVGDTGNYCSVDTPDQFFETAAAHPNYGFTQFIVRNGPGPLGALLEPEVPVGELK